MNFSTKNHEHKKQNKNVVSKTTFLKTALLLITALFINCTDDDNLSQDQLPPITQNGANTFGAIVDGRVFIPANSFSTTPGNSEFKGLRTLIGKDFINSNGDDKFTMLSGNFKINPNIYIYIYIPTLKNNMSFIFDVSDGLENSDLTYPHIYCQINGNDNLYLSFANSGQIDFSKIDFNNNIYSGTFSVKLKNKDDENDIIEITNGRFDINLNTVNN